jgi:hypothetical protein
MFTKAFALVTLFFFCPMPQAGAMPADWHTADSLHVAVFYQNAPPGLIRKIVKASEAQFLSITQRMGLRQADQWVGQKRMKIHIFDDRSQYQSGTGEPAWSDGTSIQKVKSIYSFAGAKNFINVVLPHEMGHVIFRNIIGFENTDVPAWIEEGVSTLQEKRDHAYLRDIIRDARSTGALISVHDLSLMDIRDPANKAKIDLFYAQSYSIVQYLTRRFGWEKFLSVCRAPARSGNIDAGLAAGFVYKDIEELERDWQRRGI